MTVLRRVAEALVRPFYRGIDVWPLNVRFIKYPIYRQISIRYTVWCRRFYSREEPVLITVTPQVAFKMFCQGNRGALEMDLHVGRIFEPEISRLIVDRLATMDLFVDVGANIGYYSLVAASVFGTGGRVLAFEPIAETRGQFVRNMQLNHVESVDLQSVALGRRSDEVTIELRDELGHNSLLKDDSAVTGRTEVVHVRRLDDLVARRGERILIKIDTEGYEFEALKGMERLLTENDCELVAEFTPAYHRRLAAGQPDYSVEMLKYLERLGYVIAAIDGSRLQPIVDPEEFVRTLRFQADLFARKVDAV